MKLAVVVALFGLAVTQSLALSCSEQLQRCAVSEDALMKQIQEQKLVIVGQCTTENTECQHAWNNYHRCVAANVDKKLSDGESSESLTAHYKGVETCLAGKHSGLLKLLGRTRASQLADPLELAVVDLSIGDIFWGLETDSLQLACPSPVRKFLGQDNEDVLANAVEKKCTLSESEFGCIQARFANDIKLNDMIRQQQVQRETCVKDIRESGECEITGHPIALSTCLCKARQQLQSTMQSEMTTCMQAPPADDESRQWLHHGIVAPAVHNYHSLYPHAYAAGYHYANGAWYTPAGAVCPPNFDPHTLTIAADYHGAPAHADWMHGNGMPETGGWPFGTPVHGSGHQFQWNAYPFRGYYGAHHGAVVPAAVAAPHAAVVPAVTHHFDGEAHVVAAPVHGVHAPVAVAEPAVHTQVYPTTHPYVNNVYHNNPWWGFPYYPTHPVPHHGAVSGAYHWPRRSEAKKEAIE